MTVPLTPDPACQEGLNTKLHAQIISTCYIGYIDLSKRRVSPDDVVKCEERYNKAKVRAC